MTRGMKVKTYKGVPIAVEHHADSSVTLSKEVCVEIIAARDVPRWVKNLITRPPSKVFMMNDRLLIREDPKNG